MKTSVIGGPAPPKYPLWLRWRTFNYTWFETEKSSRDTSSGGTTESIITNQIFSCGRPNLPADRVNKCQCIYPDCWEEVAWEQSESCSLRRNNSVSGSSARRSSRGSGDGSKPAAPSTDSCWLAFLHRVEDCFFLPRGRSFIQFISNHRKAQSARPWTSVVSAEGLSSEIIKFVLLKPCSLWDK